jgi:hypothetical protein
MLVREPRPQALHLGAVAEAVQNDVGPSGGEHLGDAEADAAGGSGDEGGLSLEHGDSFRVAAHDR